MIYRSALTGLTQVNGNDLLRTDTAFCGHWIREPIVSLHILFSPSLAILECHTQDQPR